MHYTYEQLKAHAESPVPGIEEHLKTCSVCYEEILLIKIVAYQSTLPLTAKPSARFMENLEAKMLPKRGALLSRFVKPTYWIPALAAASLLIALNIHFFRSEAAMQLSYTEGVVTINGQPASRNQKIGMGDTVKTSEEALAVINLGNRADITLMPATEISITVVHTANLPEIAIRQHSGYTYNRIAKGKTRYTLSTDKFDAVVRGTQFAVDLDHGDGRIKLIEGQLELRRSELKTSLMAGYAIRINGEKFSVMKDLAPHEVEFTRNFQAIPFPAPALQKGVDVPGENIEALLRGEDEPWTLAEIKRRYKKISVIYTRSGSRYIGGFYSSNSTINIQTVAKKIRVPARDIDKIIPYDH